MKKYKYHISITRNLGQSSIDEKAFTLINAKEKLKELKTHFLKAKNEYVVAEFEISRVVMLPDGDYDVDNFETVYYKKIIVDKEKYEKLFY